MVYSLSPGPYKITIVRLPAATAIVPLQPLVIPKGHQLEYDFDTKEEALDKCRELIYEGCEIKITGPDLNGDHAEILGWFMP